MGIVPLALSLSKGAEAKRLLDEAFKVEGSLNARLLVAYTLVTFREMAVEDLAMNPFLTLIKTERLHTLTGGSMTRVALCEGFLNSTSRNPALELWAATQLDRAQARDSHHPLIYVLRGVLIMRNRGDRAIENYAAVAREAQRLAGPEAMATFDLTREPAALRERYGSEFGQRLLLARRLVQAGTRFVEVTSNLNFKNGTGWDTHNEGQLKQHLLIDALDEGLSVLIADLEKRKLLDTTLVVVATEFGRPPEFDAGGGRGHHSKAFSIALFGGGLKTGQAIGTTDELGRKILNRPVSVPDLHATMYSALGINPAKELYTDDARPVPITDHGKAIGELFG